MARITTHPGEMLLEEFMKPNDLTAADLGRLLNVPANRISELVRARRAMTADTALRLERLFQMPAGFWMGLQASYDVSKAQAENDYSALKAFQITHAAE
jgi:antitoxin HigA-1